MCCCGSRKAGAKAQPIRFVILVIVVILRERVEHVRKMSIIKREKEYYVEFTRCYYEVGKKNKKNDVNDKKLVCNLARARRAIIDIIRLNLELSSCLLTLTYKENMQDYERAYKDFNKFVKRVEYRYKISLRYLRVIELQKRGAIHFQSA